MVHSFARNVVVTHYTWTTQARRQYCITRKVNNRGCYSHNPFPFMKSNEIRTAFSVHHFSRLSVAIVDDLIVVLDMYSKAIFCSKIADHSGTCLIDIAESFGGSYEN